MRPARASRSFATWAIVRSLLARRARPSEEVIALGEAMGISKKTMHRAPTRWACRSANRADAGTGSGCGRCRTQ